MSEPTPDDPACRWCGTTLTKTIAADTTIDGGGLITISGGNSVRVFSVVDSGVKFTVENLTIANGRGGINNSGAFVNVGGNNTWQGPITLDANPGFALLTYPVGVVSFAVLNPADVLTISADCRNVER